jgi:2-polyprenyl-3-methyl-5-hydroxy-6-metoxy-1,4-benzoquinol methylase
MMNRRWFLGLAASAPLVAFDEERDWRDFLDWLKKQPAGTGNVWQQYRAKLAKDGMDPAEINRIIQGLSRRASQSDELTSVLFNRIYTSSTPEFQTAPNGWLVECMNGVKPGTALDIGMGQGRNSLYLARNGWNVTGFDVSQEGVQQARSAAKKAGLKLNALVQPQEEFDYGQSRWDLVAMIYTWVPLSDAGLIGKIRQSLRPGGLLVFENFLIEPGQPNANNPGAATPNQALRAFTDLRILRYEDRTAPSDWAAGPSRVARLLATRATEPRP